MPGPPAAVAAVRVAVRAALTARSRPGGVVLVGCSGGADSLVLAAATAFVAPRLRSPAGAVVVDHGLQTGSAGAAGRAAQQCRELGLDPVEVVRVKVAEDASGPEAAARQARYAALTQTATRLKAAVVLLGHTRDDQAEQVLLGLSRGSGTRSLSGMPFARPLHPGSPVLLVRPLLGLPRSLTVQACRELGLDAWQDPHNADPRYARVRARRALSVLEDSLGPGLSAALARSADLLRDDAAALDAAADTAYGSLGQPPWSVHALGALPAGVRRRLWQRLAQAGDAPSAAPTSGSLTSGSLTSEHLRSVDALVADWHGQGPVALPGGVQARRRGGRVWLEGSAPS
jgi:tRNA(Ile)-lysidine synthase